MSRTYVKKICLFGGTGFVGSSIIKLLAKNGHELKIATRSPFDEDVLELKSTVSDPGQIKIEKINRIMYAIFTSQHNKLRAQAQII